MIWPIAAVVFVFAIGLILAFRSGFSAGQDDVLRRVVPPLDKAAIAARGYRDTLLTISAPSDTDGDPKTIAKAALRMGERLESR